MLNTNRRFRVVFLDREDVKEKDFSMKELLLDDDGTELCYAAQDIADDILDLKLWETLFFQTNRDDKNAKGLIIRID